MKEKVAVIDYGLGNVKSVMNMFKYIGAEAFLAFKEEDIKGATKYILPGVGAFDKAIEKIRQSGLEDILKEEILIRGKMCLGICLGMQLLANSSEEGSQNGLCWINQQVIKFKQNDKMGNNLKIPHMGWNTVVDLKPHKIFDEIKRPMRFYFVHSYYYEIEGNQYAYGVTNYGYDFASVIVKDNLIGVQFHPEKSHIYGMQFLKNYVELK